MPDATGQKQGAMKPDGAKHWQGATLVGIGRTNTPQAFSVGPTGAVDTEADVELPLLHAPAWLSVVTWIGAAALVFSAILMAAPDNSGGDASISRPAQAAPAAHTTAGPAPAQDLVELVVRASPASARVIVDGTAVEGNPFRAFYPRSSSVHRVVATAEGYDSKHEDVAFASDVAIELRLTSLTTPARPARPTSDSVPAAPGAGR